MKKFLSDIYKSLMYGDGGFSGRNLSAVFSVLIAGFMSIQHYPKELIIVWLCNADLNLGLVTAQQIIEFRTGKKDDAV
jgi:hypothetical protein